MKNSLFRFFVLFALLTLVQERSFASLANIENDPKIQLITCFEDARKYVLGVSTDQIFDELSKASTKDLKESHVADFHQAFRVITESGHTAEEYKDNYFKALVLSSFIAKQIQKEPNQEIHQIGNFFSSIAQHLSLIKKHVRHPGTLLFENLFGCSTRNDVLLCRLRGGYFQTALHASSLDPLYRVVRIPGKCLENFWDQWLQATEKDVNTPPFYLWLLQHEGASKIQRREGDELPPVALNHYAVPIEEGKVLAQDGARLFAFKNNSLYMRDGTNHDKLIGPVPVECAGMVTVTNNKISLISNHSGHYCPTPFHLLRVIKKLFERNVFADDAEVEIHYVNENGALCIYKDQPLKLKSLDLDALKKEFMSKHYFTKYKTITTEVSYFFGDFTSEVLKVVGFFNIDGDERPTK